MNVRRQLLPALLGLTLLTPASAFAQQAGTVELGGFLQLDRLDEALRTKRLGGGAGGRIGIFLSPRWELEADASYSQADPEPTRTSKAQINYYVGRLNYNIPWGGSSGNAVILSGGAGMNRVDAHSDLVLSPGIGLRAMLSNAIGLRFDITGMIAPNPASQTYKYPNIGVNPPAGTVRVNDQAAYLSNYQARAGISLLLGNRKPYVAPVMAPAPAPEPMPQPAPVQRAPEPPAPRVNQDSIDAARALADARNLLNAPIYFDYDKSEIRADAKSVLDGKLAILRANPSMRIRIEGNTDTRGSNEYNQALGLRRANAARRYLVAQGIDNARFEVVSFGEERPVAQGDSEDAHQRNRRDDFVITVGSDNITVPR